MTIEPPGEMETPMKKMIAAIAVVLLMVAGCDDTKLASTTPTPTLTSATPSPTRATPTPSATRTTPTPEPVQETTEVAAEAPAAPVEEPEVQVQEPAQDAPAPVEEAPAPVQEAPAPAPAPAAYYLRHTYASWLIQDGVPLTRVCELLGHASIQMTERYAHLEPVTTSDIEHAIRNPHGANMGQIATTPGFAGLRLVTPESTSR